MTFWGVGLIVGLVACGDGAGGRDAADPHASAAGPAADQRADRLRRAARLAVPVWHSRHRGAADRVQRRGVARGADRRLGHGPHSRHAERGRRLQGRPAGQECPRLGPEGVSHRRRRADLPDAAAGLEQLELLGGGRRSGQGAPFGPGDGQVGADRSRLDLRQHRRHLAGPARRPVQRHPGEQEVPRHEGAVRRDPRHGLEGGNLLDPLDHLLRQVHRRFQRRSGRRLVREAGQRQVLAARQVLVCRQRRPPMGGLGIRLPEVRLESQRRAARGGDEQGPAAVGTRHRLQPLEFRPLRPCGRLGPAGQLLAHDGRHLGLLGPQRQRLALRRLGDRFHAGPLGALRRPGPLERSGHAGGGPRGLGTATARHEADAGRAVLAHQHVVPAVGAAADRLRHGTARSLHAQPAHQRRGAGAGPGRAGQAGRSTSRRSGRWTFS